jgi:hypothetical protein
MPKALVTIGTDGFTNFVLFSDGTRYTLGAVSPLKFVVETCSSNNAARIALDGFLAGGQAMFMADTDRAWELLKPKRARWSTVDPAFSLIPPLNQTLLTRQGNTMAGTDQFTGEAISRHIARIEGQVSLLNERAKTASAPLSDEIDALRTMVAALNSPGALRSYEQFRLNHQLALGVIACVDETNARVDQLVTAGKRFDAPRAKGDLHRIASKVAQIVQTADLGQAGVQRDLAALAKTAEDIRGLFAGAKV